MGPRNHGHAWTEGRAESRQHQLGYGPPTGLPKPNWFVSPQHEGPAELLQDHLHLSMRRVLYLLEGTKGSSDIRKVTENKATAGFAWLDGTK